jgi:hypothetical protein
LGGQSRHPAFLILSPTFDFHRLSRERRTKKKPKKFQQRTTKKGRMKDESISSVLFFFLLLLFQTNPNGRGREKSRRYVDLSNRFVACLIAGGGGSKLRPAFTLRLLFLHVGDTPPPPTTQPKELLVSKSTQQNEQSNGGERNLPERKEKDVASDAMDGPRKRGVFLFCSIDKNSIKRQGANKKLVGKLFPPFFFLTPKYPTYFPIKPTTSKNPKICWPFFFFLLLLLFVCVFLLNLWVFGLSPVSQHTVNMKGGGKIYLYGR